MTPEAESDLKLEIGHVLTMDVVAYSTLLITEQTRVMSELTGIVKEAARFRRSEAKGKLVRIPTGDGMTWCSSTIRRRQSNVRCKSLRRLNLILKSGCAWGFTAGL